MYPGGLTTQAPGDTKDMIRHFQLDHIGGRSLRIRFQPNEEYQGRYYGIFINGVYQSPPVFAPIGAVVEAVRMFDIGAVEANVFLEDFGDWDLVSDGDAPGWRAEVEEADTADRLSFRWDPPDTFSQANQYVSDVRGDTQISAISMTGLVRNVNCETVPQLETRSRLSYQIEDVSGTRFVSWYNGDALVAQGSRVGDGSVTCTEQNDSGLEITCTITYTGDVGADTAYVQLTWPEQYQVHYSTSALVFPRSPEATVDDIGEAHFSYLSASLPAGTYNAAIVPVRDGIPQAAGISVTSGLVIVTPPAPPVLSAPTGNAAATTINWAVGEAGCTYTVYFSDIDTPINWGNFALPAPIVTGVDATSQVLPAIVGYPGRVRLVVRASKGGVEEKNGAEQVIEYDSSGVIVGARPNRASIQDIETDGLTVTVKTVIDSLEAAAAATFIDLYVKPVGTPFVLGTPEASEALSAAVDYVQVKEISHSVAYPGFYHLEVRARTAAGIRSVAATERFVFLENAAPTLGPDDLDIIVARGDRA